MTRGAMQSLSDVEVLRHQARTTHQVVRLCVEGVTHDESLIQPQPGGNCMNWVVGHLVWAYQGALPLLGQEPVMKPTEVERYARHSPPIKNPEEAVDFDNLMDAWDKSAERLDAGLSRLTPEVLDQPAANSPTGNPNETVRSLLATMLFHQAYHAGQTAVLRRITGKPGAIN
jgi:uncharacterized damage-inducible protein DinB